MRARAKVDVARINELEARVKHDVIAFTMAVGESIGDPAAARWLHYGMTSNDVVDTAQALLVRDASRIIERDLVLFGEVLDLRAHEFQHTPQIGRTHGIHAEPITFGLKIANWFAENQRNIARFREAPRGMEFGKISGAVGNASHLGPEIEEKICKRLGLKVTPVASQVIQRDRHAHYLSALALIAATLEKIALEIRHLQRTEVREAEEHFRRRAARQFRDAAQAQSRDLRTDLRAGAAGAQQHDGVVRKCGAVARARYFAQQRRAHHPAGFHDPGGLHAREDDRDRQPRCASSRQRMLRNLESTQGLVFSGQLLQDLVEKGMPRDDAYKAVQENAMAAWETETSFRERVAKDARITKYLDAEGAGAYFRFEAAVALRGQIVRSRVWRASRRRAGDCEQSVGSTPSHESSSRPRKSAKQAAQFKKRRAPGCPGHALLLFRSREILRGGNSRTKLELAEAESTQCGAETIRRAARSALRKCPREFYRLH